MALTKLVPQPFEPGKRLEDGSQLNAVLANPAVSVTAGESAAGAAAAAAVPLFAAINQLATVAAATGALLAALTPGQSQVVFNDGANSVTIYARSGYTIDGAANVPLANAKRCIYYCVSPGVIISAQLGVVSA